jgi:hypothetical protein
MVGGRKQKMMNVKKELAKKLPEILGFGERDDKGLKVQYLNGDKKNPQIHVVYRDRRGDLVYKVEMGNESCLIEEFFQGRSIAQAAGQTLKEAFSNLFMTFKGNPRFQALVERMKNGKKVHIQDPSGGGIETIFFPAGFIFVLRFPVIGQERLDRIEGLNAIPLHSLRLHSINQGKILILNEEGKLLHRSVPMAQITCTLWDLEESVERIFAEGLIPENESGAICLQALSVDEEVPGSFSIYHWFEGERIFFFSFLLEREGDISLEQAADYLWEHGEKIKNFRRWKEQNKNITTGDI